MGPSVGGKTSASKFVGPDSGRRTSVSKFVGPTSGGRIIASRFVGPTSGGRTSASKFVGPTSGGRITASRFVGPKNGASIRAIKFLGPLNGVLGIRSKVFFSSDSTKNQYIPVCGEYTAKDLVRSVGNSSSHTPLLFQFAWSSSARLLKSSDPRLAASSL